ncbi:adenylate/guanylate cyclase [Rhizobium sp. PDO1-076]|uniref:nickel-binding protein n=1 Tax=Rhizobium sp. PDO1-076 TaxID=1125979 RepID=UPI00024E2CAE|nr:nickel-binding protein [Rhizobium sp. PDO1-076]EHS52996.1 adenylate/guanylate cyclase [Rhizobium sp. PDO1-076]
MPIFMDRHDLAGASAADVAEAHLKDLSIQDQYGVKFLTYWFDHRRGTTFCLIDAPDVETAQCVHREAHGFIAGEVVEVALSAVEAFLGRIQDPTAAAATSSHMDAGHRAILFTDIVGSTEMTSRLGDRMATELVRAHDALVRGCLGRQSGREVKHTGDGIMAAFSSTVFAVDCAIDIQREFHHFNLGSSEPIHIRIGLDCGEPVEDSNDLFGKTVQLAARLCAAAGSDQILISENICQEYGMTSAFTNGGHHRLKGFAKPVLAYRCEWLN